MRGAIFFCILFSLAACEPGDFIDLPTSEQRITIIAYNEAGVPWLVIISPTAQLTGFLPKGLPEAKVTIYEDGNFVEVLTLDPSDPETNIPRPLDSRPSHFRSETNSPRPGHEYKVVVEADGYPTATASYVQPMPVEADITFEFRDRKFRPGYVSHRDGTITIDTSYTTTFDVSITFTDPAGENYYDFWQIQSDKQTMAESKSWYGQNLFFESGVITGGASFYGRVLDDRMISGERVTLNFTTSFNAGSAYTILPAIPEWFTISLRTTTKEMYEFGIQNWKALMSEYDPYAQPVRTYTNVENGLGIFGGYTPYSKQFYYKGVD